MLVILDDFKKFLKKIKLTNYEINAYFSLLKSQHSTAREICIKTRIPNGRIYDVLASLNGYGLIEIQESRPKKYKATPPNVALKALIAKVDEERQEETKSLYREASELEKKIAEAGMLGIDQSNRVFWSTAYGIQSIVKLYRSRLRDLKGELLFTGFITDDTLKVLHLANTIYSGLKACLANGGNVRFLWSFDFDERPLSDLEKRKNDTTMLEVERIMEETFSISRLDTGFEMKYVYFRLPMYFDVLNKREVIFKFRNPLFQSQISVCLSVIDPGLTNEFHNYFYELWERKALELRNG